MLMMMMMMMIFAYGILDAPHDDGNNDYGEGENKKSTLAIDGDDNEDDEEEEEEKTDYLNDQVEQVKSGKTCAEFSGSNQQALPKCPPHYHFPQSMPFPHLPLTLTSRGG